MIRRSRRVAVKLGARELEELPEHELLAILRGADDLIARGGRTLLMRILRGSASKDVLERGLDQSPVYGYFADLSNEDTLARIDWAILNGYLNIEQINRLPRITYTRKGWEIERAQFADELLADIEKVLEGGPPYNMAYLKDRDREMILLLLDKIAATGDAAFIPALEAWKAVDHKKVQKRIGQILHQLKANSRQ